MGIFDFGKKKKIYKQIIEKYKEETAKPCCEILLSDENEISILDDKLGGTPYFPEDEIYPVDKNGEPMALLLQLNLKHIDLEGFPKEGVLEIFTEKELDWPINAKLFLFPEGQHQKKDLPIVNTERFIITKPFKIKFNKTISHMPVSDYRADDTIKHIAYQLTGNQNEIEDIFDDKIYDDLNLCIPNACIGGYADFTQTDPRYAEDNRDACVFKLDSALHDSIDLGDSGILTVTISPEDLDAGIFENAVVDWDCC